jgi:hypothetical protein
MSPGRIVLRVQVSVLPDTEGGRFALQRLSVVGSMLASPASTVHSEREGWIPDHVPSKKGSE